VVPASMMFWIMSFTSEAVKEVENGSPRRPGGERLAGVARLTVDSCIPMRSPLRARERRATGPFSRKSFWHRR